MLSLPKVVESEATSNERLFFFFWLSGLYGMPLVCNSQGSQSKTRANRTWMEGALWHTPAIKVSKALTTNLTAHSISEQTSVTMAYVTNVLLEFHEPYSAMEKSSCKNHPTNLYAHIQYILREIRLYGALLVHLVWCNLYHFYFCTQLF